MSTTPIQQIITPGAAAQRALAPTPSSSSQSGIPRLNAISSSSTKSVPAFLNKLYNMVNDPSTNDLIHWSEDGTTFVVPRHEDFAREVLPRFFKHNNFSSFVRQLNMYGFHKVPHLQQGVLHSDGEGEIWEFANPHFQRNQPDLISLVTRKRGRDSDDKESHGHGTIDYNQIMAEISAIKRHQITISTDLKNIQRDNQLLWTETIATRERYQRQQETMEKIMRFLGSMLTLKKDAIVPKKNPLRLTARETTASPPMASSRANFLEPLGGSASLERGDGRDTATAGGFGK
ncbi:uncharacterized protein BJ171DRAFT_418076 [Polychytrium aggregatum]|uniref:uncharacterized protein n=1 Tax=Polychytrium aggregatum TaxID=110093 RepID=UPI0022FF1D19|nr:uncharacterized protein BJ171DRAFT_418076 [Polychytrium aggregatum]KAI9209701.1 hypothetical protein BJ171DRAFT_418076 [Polychytrium aggregatum]